MVIWWYIWQFLRKFHINYLSCGTFQESQPQKEEDRFCFPIGGHWGRRVRLWGGWYSGLPNKRLGQEKERQLCAILILKVQMVWAWRITAGVVLLAWALCSWTLESALLTRERDRGLAYELDSRTDTVLICIKSHMLCCRDFHCACFRTELTLLTECFSFA